jgi:hypothetical protein
LLAIIFLDIKKKLTENTLFSDGTDKKLFEKQMLHQSCILMGLGRGSETKVMLTIWKSLALPDDFLTATYSNGMWIFFRKKCGLQFLSKDKLLEGEFSKDIFDSSRFSCFFTKIAPDQQPVSTKTATTAKRWPKDAPGNPILRENWEKLSENSVGNRPF